MIATGGLLRINARRQDSLRSKPHKPHPPKKKNKRPREVVVVKGKLKLCSVPGFVAILGILVLLVGGVMAALGYWPRDGLFLSALPQGDTAMASVLSSSSTPALADAQQEWRVEESKGDGGKGGSKGFNQTNTINGTTPRALPGFLEDFLDRYLYSDRLKVFGPLVMGIGIFLFICANAVLHENRDRKTKVINLRDIYSTVIDHHTHQKPASSGSTHSNPLNGLVNYVQSKSLETKTRMNLPSPLTRQEAGRAAGAGDGGGVFSIYQDPLDALPPSSSYSPPNISCWLSHQKEVLSSFTLPLHRSRPLSPPRRHSMWGGSRRGWGGVNGGEEEEWRMWGDRQEEKVCVRPPLPGCSPIPPSCRLLQELSSGGSQALLLLNPSHLSLSSLSHLLSSPSSPPAHPHRRLSLPTCSTNVGYSSLSPKEESCDWSSSLGGAGMSQAVTSQVIIPDWQGLQVRGEEEEG
ncbi:transmembrane protein 200C [Cololabis saira]|uniref:transmembrane protein 200C n=1 Tax=Cololabis saira TaxID=129043 RepID=UPI002AD3A624|nr:transmembrane protein 200C [Cololabis saira]